MKKLLWLFLSWLKGLSLLLTDVSAEDKKDGDKDDAGDGDKGDGDDGDKGDGDDNDDDNDDGDGDGDAGADSGKDGGKDRSKFIPRERFDKVNARASQVNNLVTLGVLTEDDDGNLQVNPEVMKSQGKKGDSDGKDGAVTLESLKFTKEEVTGDSWPLVEKINKAYDLMGSQVGQLIHVIRGLQAENAVIRDFPEFISKDSPLRKKAMDILKNDPEFKRTYKGNPEAGYWAVKRAVDLLAGKSPQKTGKKKKSFVIDRGDGGGQKKGSLINLSGMSREDLDKQEKAEHDRLQRLKKK